MGGAASHRSHLVGLSPCDQPGASGESVPGTGGEKFFGLVNVANTCYANSVIQALYFCNPFRRMVLRHLSEDREDEGADESLLTSLAELFAQIESQTRAVGCLTPRRFLAKLRKANDLFCTSEHQDAHEFMEFLLNDIVEYLTKKVTKERERARDAAGPGDKDKDQPEEEPRTWVHDIFQGYLVNQIKCRCCESVTVRRENFLDLSVDIQRHTSTAACLRAFESTELLRAENKFFCDTCGCLQEAEKRLRVYQLPSVLTLHLKRFKYVERLGRCCRLPYRVVFPLQLQVEHQPPPQKESRYGQAGGAGVSTPTSTGANGTRSKGKPPSRVFELRSVVVHIGRDLTRGHYVTVVRSGDRCVLLDDDVVRVVEPDVFRAFYGTPGDTVAHGETGGVRGGQNDWYPSRSSSPPLYERSPEGTCCGYLLFYEAVDGDVERPSAAMDMSAASQWISEDVNHTYSDSGESDDDRRGPVAQARQPEPPAEAELTQVFEQRCIPGYAAPATSPAGFASVRGGGDGSARGPPVSPAASGGMGGAGVGGSPGHV